MIKIIAEFCQNHNGKLDILKRMIEKAALSGATHAKIQTIYANTLSFRPQFENGLDLEGEIKCIKRPYKQEYDRLKNLELTPDDMHFFVDSCITHGLIPLTTCFARCHIKLIKELGFQEIKIASYDCASYPMIRELADAFPVLTISTGATFDDELAHTAELLRGKNFSYLHCVTLYPTPLNQLHLCRMERLRQYTPMVGFSDHSKPDTDGLIASKAALAFGADIIERHFTVLNRADTRDGPVSVNPSELAELVEFSRLTLDERKDRMGHIYKDWSELAGTANRAMTREELLNRDYYRGRFASPRAGFSNGEGMIFNWEETPVSCVNI